MSGYKRQNIADFDQESVITRLMVKVTSQAKELSEIHHQLEESITYIARLERKLEHRNDQSSSSSQSFHKSTSLSSSTDLAALRRSDRESKDHIQSLQKQIKSLESRLQDSVNSKKALCKSIDTKTREVKVLERKIKELQAEPGIPSNALKSTKDMQRYIAQLERELKASLALIDQLELKTSNRIPSNHEHDHHPSDDNQQSDQIQSMERQIVLLQQKLHVTQDLLKQSQPHPPPVSSSNAGDKKLNDMERERDILLEYIHDDMEKSGKILERLNEVERESVKYKQDNDDLVKKLNFTQEALESEVQRVKSLEAELSSSHEKLRQNMKSIEKLEAFRNRYHVENEKKTIESEELANVQVTLLMQIRDKDGEIASQKDEIRKLKTKVHEYELTLPVLEHDSATIKQRLLHKEEEINRLHQKLDQLEPIKHQLEPELNRLRVEKMDWLQQKQKLEVDVDRLRKIDKVIIDMNKELQKSSLSPSSSSSSSSNNHRRDVSEMKSVEVTQHFSSPTPSLGALARSSPGAYFDTPIKKLGHSFSSACLANIRQLSPLLYDMVTSIQQDTLQKESTCQEAANLIQNLSKDIQHLSSSLEDERRNITSMQNSSTKLVDEYKRKLSELERENLDMRDHRTILNQIRYAIQNHIGGKESHDMQSNRMISLSDDTNLPDYISRILMQHSQAIWDAEEMKSDYERQLLQYSNLRKSHQELQSEHNQLRSEVEVLRSELTTKEHSYHLRDSTSKQDLSKAKEIAEKQMTLVRSFESKLETINRESQLKSSQLQSIKQREETLRRRIYQILETYSESIGISSNDVSKMVPVDTSLSDLLDYVSDILRSFAYKLSSQTAHDIMIASPSLSSSAMKKTIDTSSSQLDADISGTYAHDIGDSLMLSPDFDTSNGSNSIDIRLSPNEKKVSPNHMNAASSHQHLQQLLQQQQPSYKHAQYQQPILNDSYPNGVHVSKEIHQRLMKAQIAINTMKKM